MKNLILLLILVSSLHAQNTIEDLKKIKDKSKELFENESFQKLIENNSSSEDKLKQITIEDLKKIKDKSKELFENESFQKFIENNSSEDKLKQINIFENESLQKFIGNNSSSKVVNKTGFSFIKNKRITEYASEEELFNISLSKKDFSLVSDIKDFLNEINIHSFTNSNLDHKDLSNYFPEMELQGSSLSCSGHAISSHMEYEIYKKTNRIISLSPWYTYQIMQLYDQNMIDYNIKLSDVLENNKDLEDFSSGEVNKLTFEVFKYNSLVERDYFPKGIFPINRLNPIQKNVYYIKNFTDIVIPAVDLYNPDPIVSNTPLNLDFFKLLIDNNYAPIVSITSDAREFTKEWYEPLVGNLFTHFLVIVGYGKGISPISNKEVEYFIVRDSFVKEPIHHKVAAHHLIPIIFSVSQVTDITINSN
jgi:hypothetical protein